MTAGTQAGSARAADVGAQLAEGRNPHVGFLHVGKTGGTALVAFVDTLPPPQRPLVFAHDWTVPEIAEAYPETRLCFLLRDPVERAVSGFLSRLRQGRPEYQVLWSPAEAAAFAHFRDPADWLRALISQAEAALSAALYLRASVSHLRRDYAFHFGGPGRVRRLAGHVALVGDTTRPVDFWVALTALLGLPEGVAEQGFTRRHVSARSAAEVLAPFAPVERTALAAAFAKDYAIFDALRVLGRAPRNSPSV